MEHLPGFARGKVKLPTINSDKPNEMIENLPFEDYLKIDDAISSSLLRKILISPRHYLAALSKPDDDNEDFKFGRAAHMALLEPKRFRELFVQMPDFGDFRSSKNREARDSWKADQHPNAVILTSDQMEMLTAILESIFENSYAKNLLSNGMAEVTFLYTDPITGIYCKARPDFVAKDKQGNLHIIDFKTTKETDIGSFLHTAFKKYKYHVQLGFYEFVVNGVLGQEIFSTNILTAEKSSPYQTSLIYLEQGVVDRAIKSSRFCLDTLKKSMTLGIWPGSQTHLTEWRLPAMAEYDELPEFNWGEKDERDTSF